MRILLKSLVCLACFIIIANIAFAQPPPPPPPPDQVPIDGASMYLLIAGVLFGAKKVYDLNKSKKNQ